MPDETGKVTKDDFKKLKEDIKGKKHTDTKS